MNINIAINPKSKEYTQEYTSHDHSLSSTRKVYGNMIGMDKVDEFVETSEVDKDILKDGSKSSTRRSTKSEFTFRGNLNTDDNPAPEKDITDEPKKI